MSDPSRVEDLAQRVADGLADEAMIAELEALMREDASARITYLQTLQLHQDMERKAARNTLNAGTLSQEPVLLDLPANAPTGSSRRWAIVGVAAALAMSVAAFFMWPSDQSIGEMVQVTQSEWLGSRPGKSLEEGQRLQLASGSVELRLASGVRVVLDGKTDAVLRNAMAISLNEGQLFAAVPSQAHGFRVTTPGIDVVDHGTQFGVRVGETGAAVHVFDGEVEIEQKSEARKNQTLTTAQAARFDPQGVLEDWIVPDYEGFAAPRLAPGVVSTSKAVHWFENPPPTFGFTQGSQVALVLERTNVLLEQPIDVTFDRHKTGTNSAYDTHRKVLGAGIRVDSYLMHFNPREKGNSPDGSVYFDRPIIGVIARGDQLMASDAILGRTDFAYPAEARRGLEGDSDALDVINMERDQMSVRFSASDTSIDQVRILLEARSLTPLQPRTGN